MSSQNTLICLKSAFKSRRQGVVHAIEIIPGSKTPKGRIYRTALVGLDELRRQLKELTEKGWIRPSTFPFGSPGLFVPKKKGTLRMCIDYQGLNAITVKNTEPLLPIDDLLDRVHGFLLSKLHHRRLVVETPPSRSVWPMGGETRDGKAIKDGRAMRDGRAMKDGRAMANGTATKDGRAMKDGRAVKDGMAMTDGRGDDKWEGRRGGRRQAVRMGGVTTKVLETLKGLLSLLKFVDGDGPTISKIHGPMDTSVENLRDNKTFMEVEKDELETVKLSTLVYNRWNQYLLKKLTKKPKTGMDKLLWEEDLDLEKEVQAHVDMDVEEWRSRLWKENRRRECDYDSEEDDSTEDNDDDVADAVEAEENNGDEGQMVHTRIEGSLLELERELNDSWRKSMKASKYFARLHLGELQEVANTMNKVYA
ncbi:hypothetical protein CBR_g38295 [Chara braunii]|uniref:Reverse transcriptase domain-containing protein n=1 Tax=Chara braunii TaxID=69332 RepID=A0A388LPT9_CHABU|nr:hypothetical protein CBR_g38295 [Chara braunii]|eukprot:GBG84324.1 hypothetical protein CBR_g38295 [Chara braunii]